MSPRPGRRRSGSLGRLEHCLVFIGPLEIVVLVVTPLLSINRLATLQVWTETRPGQLWTIPVEIDR